MTINVSLPHITHLWCHRKSDNSVLPYTIVCLFRCLMVYMIPSRGTPLLFKQDRLSQTAICRDSNTHLETFGDHSHIYYPEFSFHMKHMGYFSPTMNSNIVSLKYDFEEFRSKHWLYTDTFADISNEIPVISKLYSKLQFFMSKILGIVK